MQLVVPGLEYLDAYRAALETGWSPRTTRPEAAAEERKAIVKDPDAFVASLEDPNARGDGDPYLNAIECSRLGQVLGTALRNCYN